LSDPAAERSRLDGDGPQVKAKITNNDPKGIDLDFVSKSIYLYFSII